MSPSFHSFVSGVLGATMFFSVSIYYMCSNGLILWDPKKSMPSRKIQVPVHSDNEVYQENIILKLVVSNMTFIFPYIGNNHSN